MIGEIESIRITGTANGNVVYSQNVNVSQVPEITFSVVDKEGKAVNIRMEDIKEFVEKFPEILPLERLRGVPALQEMTLLQRGSRLSQREVWG